MIIQTRKMTAAQKKAQDNFKKAIAYRKKTGCTLKQAFAHVKSGKVSGLDKVVKKGFKTTVLYTKKAKKKATPKKKASQGVLFGIKKKAAPKKAVVRNYGSHKDTASHNVKISVMSGTKLGAIDLNIVGKELLQLNKDITELGYFIKNEKLIKEKNRLKEIQTIKKQQYKTLRLYLNSIAAFR
jgi:hypothetical protein